MSNHPAKSPSKNLVVGLTGSLGSGKSAAAEIFQNLGCAIFDADIFAREVVRPNSKGLEAVRTKFGPNIISSSGDLDRKKLGEIIFKDPAQRKALEEILHPLIRELWLKSLADYASAHSGEIVVYVVPLLFESGMDYPEIELIITATCPEEIKISRAMKRDNASREQVLARLKNQLPDQEKIKKSDFVIENGSNLEGLKAECKRVYQQLLQKLSQKNVNA